MNSESATVFASNLAELSSTLSYVLPVAASIAGIFGLAALAFVSLIAKKH